MTNPRIWKLKVYRVTPSKWQYTTENPFGGSFSCPSEYISGKRLALAEVSKIRASHHYLTSDSIEVEIYGSTWNKNEKTIAKKYTLKGIDLGASMD